MRGKYDKFLYFEIKIYWRYRTIILLRFYVRTIDLMSGEHTKEEFLKVNQKNLNQGNNHLVML